MSFEETVGRLLTECPGAEAVAVVAPDGIPVVIEPAGTDLEMFGAEMASVVREMNQASRELNHGSLRQFFATTDRAQVVLTPLASGYFLMVLLTPDAMTGQARLISRLAGERLHSEFV